MCRIAGIISSKTEPAETYRQVKAMCQSLQHGGPDDEGIYLSPDGAVCLGHRRLAILDLSEAGHQPMSADEGQLWISFNGEIYNFRKLRAKLEKAGSRFTTQTDTEVILKGYQHWGTKAFSALRGMFAFALYDRRKQTLYLVRDSQGIKPLYYYHKHGQLSFASEVKAFKHLQNPPETYTDWPVAFLSLGHLPEPLTTLQGVFMLPKGHYLEVKVEAETEVEVKTYYEDIAEYIITDDADVQAQVDSLLDQAIQQQLVSDAPIGVFLSGGIDSSLLALQAAKYQGEQLITTSIHFPEDHYSEKCYQDLISKRLPGKHVAQQITQQDFETYFEHILSGMDQPSVDGINSWFVSKAAREAGLKTVISGIGADELFGGYPSFRRVPQLPFIRKLRLPMSLYANLTQRDTLQRAAYLEHSPRSIFEYLFLRGFYTTGQLKTLFSIPGAKQYELLHTLPEPPDKPQEYTGAMASWYEQHYFMQNQLLKDTDNMSMQHGLEIRVPFLDETLAAFTRRLPPATLYPANQPAKHFLIHAFNNLLPREIWDRPKMGFTFPFQQWLKSHNRYRELKGRYTRNPAAKKLFAGYEQDKVHWSKIMSLLVLEQFGGESLLSA
ncbi:asparagine synthase (glutamine-hydrolyzing) (plasmid) [Pedobacter sp. BS3]|uniref:asparagine synthase (glutamine-hydrolyzing) n=1 Tax=Pedobacter sp. BS3 TaxID=2567937 RepID=UPI0011EF9753|nr:asparagine synthase (glutamine-hydrolyzing) [Pedobacter sp. BS3]TZF86186.1 asparagine synthase (glutamine-hydrolyzing) [Pedobacter sp. BS3]